MFHRCEPSRPSPAAASCVAPRGHCDSGHSSESHLLAGTHSCGYSIGLAPISLFTLSLKGTFHRCKTKKLCKASKYFRRNLFNTFCTHAEGRVFLRAASVVLSLVDTPYERPHVPAGRPSERRLLYERLWFAPTCRHSLRASARPSLSFRVKRPLRLSEDRGCLQTMPSVATKIDECRLSGMEKSKSRRNRFLDCA